GSEALRERFRRAALVGLMLLRNPWGGRRKVGGREWADRRLFERVREIDPQFVLLQQALRETKQADDAVRRWVQRLPQLTLRCRCLAEPSPFAKEWSPVREGPAETLETP